MKAIIDPEGLVVYYSEGIHPSALNEVDYEGFPTGYIHVEVRERHPWFVTKYKNGLFYDASPPQQTTVTPASTPDYLLRIEELESKLRALSKYL